MSKSIYQIYDKIFKKILTLSNTAVINLINGLFGTDYPPTSKVTHNWTEFENQELKRILADTIITINDIHSYHMEAQMTTDDNIIFRVFEYSYHHANRQGCMNEHSYELFFPEPKIIYLYSETPVPDEYTLILNFGSQGTFPYKVSTFKFMETSIEELNNKKMIILIPFSLLTLRKVMEKERSEQNLEALKNLIQNDIMKSIQNNLEVNNITLNDAVLLTRLTKMLYDHIYSHYDELKEITEMTDESLIFDVDILSREYEEKLADIEKEAYEFREKFTNAQKRLTDTEQQLSDTTIQLSDTSKRLNDTEQQLSDTTKQLQSSKSELSKAQDEINALKQQLAALKS